LEKIRGKILRFTGNEAHIILPGDGREEEFDAYYPVKKKIKLGILVE
jgi:hypothetical protein